MPVVRASSCNFTQHTRLLLRSHSEHVHFGQPLWQQIRLLKDLAFHTAKQLVRHSGWVHVTVPADSDMLPE